MWVLIWIILNPLYPRMLCVNFGWNWPSSSEERILNIFKIILLFRYYIPLEKGVVLHLNKLTWIHSTQKWFVPSLVEIGQLSDFGEDFWKNIFNNISYFCYYLPLELGVALHLNKLESPLPSDALCQVWLKLAQWFWKKKIFEYFQ